jgi:phosphoribosyl-dephospho-CoA transferase
MVRAIRKHMANLIAVMVLLPGPVKVKPVAELPQAEAE